ncbi:Rcf1 protein [Martiniozyma asiatica (nom. inval.)]|nr:Rcf1 protein [Martiniozyma asiatica]
MASQNFPSSHDLNPANPLEDMSVIDKIIYRSKQQPLVPLGCLATTAAVVMAAKGVKSGNAPQAQFWFRWRVGLQGATLVALVLGSMYFDKTFSANQKSEEDLAIEKARMRQKIWIEELEQRDQEMKDRQARAERARELLQQQKSQQSNESSSEK